MNLVSNAYAKLRSNDRKTNLLILLFVVAFGASLIARYVARHAESMDYTIFLNPWITQLGTHGLSSLGENFSNYNAPYLILLWLASHLPFSHLASIKLISVIFDIILALSVWLVIHHYRPNAKYLPYLGFLAIMFAPTVLQNSAVWGQCDSIYTSFIVLAFYAHLKKRQTFSWILWAIALAFKFQAIFFLPFLGYVMLKDRVRLKPLVAAALTFILLSCPPLFFGRSLYDTFTVYLVQASPNLSDMRLALNAPTAYQWLPDNLYSAIRPMGIMIAFGGALGIVSLGLVRRFTPKAELIIATLCVLSIPFLLPVMHERYFYIAEIFLIMGGFIYTRLLPLALIMQVITLITYLGYFDGQKQNVIPYMLLSALTLYVIYKIAQLLYSESTGHTPIATRIK